MIDAVGADRFLFASEMYGTANVVDDRTGSTFDDILPLLRPRLDATDAEAMLTGNALQAFPRLAAVVAERAW
jgi:4-oxalmesaconate hydratase